MSTPHPGMLAVAIGAASIACSLAGRSEIGLGLSMICLATMAVAALASQRENRETYRPQPRPAQRCRCGRCEACDPLAQTWGDS